MSSPTPHISSIRRQWCVHEDRAIAERLQCSEIRSHYNANRMRNTHLRSDIPRASEEQKLEHIMASLSLDRDRQMIIADRALAIQLTEEQMSGCSSEVRNLIGGQQFDVRRDISQRETSMVSASADIVPLGKCEHNELKCSTQCMNSDKTVVNECSSTVCTTADVNCSDASVSAPSEALVAILDEPVASTSSYTPHVTAAENDDCSGICDEDELISSITAEFIFDQEKRDRLIAEKLQCKIGSELEQIAQRQIEADIRLAKQFAKRDRERLHRAKLRAKERKQNVKHHFKETTNDVSAAPEVDVLPDLLKDDSASLTTQLPNCDGNDNSLLSLPPRRPAINSFMIESACDTQSTPPSFPTSRSTTDVHYANIPGDGMQTNTSSMISGGVVDGEVGLVNISEGRNKLVDEEPIYINLQTSAKEMRTLAKDCDHNVELTCPRLQEANAATSVGGQPPPYMPMQMNLPPGKSLLSERRLLFENKQTKIRDSGGSSCYQQ